VPKSPFGTFGHLTAPQVHFRCLRTSPAGFGVATMSPAAGTMSKLFAVGSLSCCGRPCPYFFSAKRYLFGSDSDPSVPVVRLPTQPPCSFRRQRLFLWQGARCVYHTGTRRHKRTATTTQDFFEETRRLRWQANCFACEGQGGCENCPSEVAASERTAAGVPPVLNSQVRRQARVRHEAAPHLSDKMKALSVPTDRAEKGSMGRKAPHLSDKKAA
jgi:hypothetical protein